MIPSNHLGECKLSNGGCIFFAKAVLSNPLEILVISGPHAHLLLGGLF